MNAPGYGLDLGMGGSAGAHRDLNPANSLANIQNAIGYANDSKKTLDNYDGSINGEASLKGFGGDMGNAPVGMGVGATDSQSAKILIDIAQMLRTALGT